ncbi:probable inactive peptidyl-prolyl cis-trans isomerase-like 6 isoform X1 [Salmo salar]|uniref:Peptidyl-prolyl cis-trans isomerase n=1 Tax=Salmo salar TaxID=8030 RepID=A0A1S3S9D8_SALSA|nr:probable inactive peptidyl-prolyl cis-trans isomerase-like 6 isoform X1 [Salmo salar]|eukprot:XP_014060964.1 PREDICTED: peptidyl-prolyl cis-trans isomerase-like 6 isoform X1 [Salmo salar]
MTSEVYLEIVGLMKEHHFQIAKSIAEGLKQKFPTSFLDPTIRPLLECDWHVYLTNKKRELKGEVWQFSSNLMCFVNGCLLGNEKDLTSWAEKQWEFTLIRPHALYLALADDYYSKHLNSTGHTFVYMDVSIRGESVGRLLFELFTELCPKTCKNFQALCTGEAGLSQSDLMLSYKGSVFHRVVPNGWIQGGDISAPGKGNGGESIYGPTFEDESFAVSHSRRGILGMANQGPHSNSSQFYITLQPAFWMDRKYVAFGQVVEGTEVLRRLEEVPTYNERPKQDCKVADCGVFEP